MSQTGFFSFSRPFYVINGIELLERGAFYTMNYVLATYMLTTLAIPAAEVGLIAAIMLLLLYIVPLLGAALAEKYGYKAALAASFAFLAAGYATTLAAQDFYGMLTAVVLIGLGAGVFKPIAAAVVSQTSSEPQRNYAFMIYYGAINLGATIFPLGAGLVVIFAPELIATVAFGAAMILSLLNLAFVLTLWRNIVPPQKEKSVLQALASLKDIFHHPKLVVLLVIYSGFWFLYAMSLTFVPAYMLEFQRMPSWFNPLLLGVINPLVIVVAAPFMGHLTRPFGSLQLMIGGISLYVLGFIVLGFSATSFLFVAGIVVFSIGELFTHPSFLSYVSKIAPPDKVSVFMGYGFLPIGIGLFFGAGVGGVLYGTYAQQAGTPAVFWAIMSGAALVTVAALLIYNRVITPRAKDVAPGPGEPTRRGRGALGTIGFAALALLLVPALIVTAGFVPAGQAVEPAETDDGIAPSDLVTLALPPESGTANERERVRIPITFPANATGTASFALSWTDEPASSPANTNAPDRFRIHVTLPDGTMLQSDESATGSLELKVEDIVPGSYVVEIELVDAGDETTAVAVPLIPVATSPDTSNAFELAIRHQASA